MNVHTLLIFVFSLVSCGGKPVTGTTDSGNGSGSSSEGTTGEGDTSTAGSLDILCEEAISQEECEVATPPEGMLCAWLSITKVAAQPDSDCTDLSSEGRCHAGFVDVQAGGLAGGCCPQYMQTAPGTYDAYGGWECFRITSDNWVNCCDLHSVACGCYTGP